MGAAVCAASAAAPQVQVFAPLGEAKNVRQASARFSDAMVALGDPRAPDPFTVKCTGGPDRTQGRGRWIDARNWVYDFLSTLPGGERCQFVLKPKITTLAGQALGGVREFGFHTGGPAVLASLPHDGDVGIDEEQVFLVALDARPDAGSLDHLWCEAAGVGERIPARLLTERATREVLAAQGQGAYALFAPYMDNGEREPRARLRIDDARWREVPVVAVQCVQRLPAGADAALVLGAGLKSASGIARSAPQRIAFKVRPAFVVSLTCQRMSPDAACLPITPITLSFNAPVPRGSAAAIRLKSEHGTSWTPSLELHVKSVDSVSFTGPFPESAKLTVALPRNFRDDAGREPENKGAFPLATATDGYPPLVKFPGRFGILEANADPMLPVTVRNVEPALAGRQLDVSAAATSIPGRSVRVDDETEIIERYRAFRGKDDHPVHRETLGRYPREGEIAAIRPNERASAFELPRTANGRELEVIGIPMRKPGFYIVELASPRLGRALHGEDKPYYVSTSVLVTNLAVHLKHGRESSLAWVTALDSGKPVPGARVSVRDCRGKLWFDGRTDGSGLAQIGDALPVQAELPSCHEDGAVLIAFARLGEDLTFTYSNWNSGIQPWNFNLRSALHRRQPFVIHTVFDRPLFRAGETVGMKHLARAPSAAGFAIPELSTLPPALEIEHVGSGQKVKLAARFDAQGVAESTWTIPAEARLGTYRVNWPGREIDSRASFRVEAFRVPLMNAVLAAPAEAQVRPAEVKLTAAVHYLAGGPAAGMPVRVRHFLEERHVRFAGYPDFRFGGRPPRVGVHTGADEDPWSFDADPDAAQAQPGAAATRTVTLDATGGASVTIDRLPAVDRPATLNAELEYVDPNGEVSTVASRVPLHTAALYVGIKPEGWAANRNTVRAQLVTLDTAGRPVSGRRVVVEVYERRTYSHRRRLVGGFYAYDSTTELRHVGTGCSATSDARGFVFCAVKPRASGELILLARAKDDAGREAHATTSVWVVGEREWWFDPADHDRIDLIAEKREYEPGETAKLQVRMPFREAAVLVTVEREGVLWQRVVELRGTSPVIEVPVAGHFGPNVFVSALAVRGRVDPERPGPYAWLKRIVYRVGYWLRLVDEVPVERDTRPTALVDLAKPAYKLGLTEIKVGRSAYALDVKVVPDRETFKVRETARVAIAVADASGKPAAHGEIALAAVDEGLLELMGNGSWNILEGMLGERPVEVSTATAQGQVIGKRHFGRKAVPAGGGGGRAGARELFDTLLVWQARVPLDQNGRAQVDVPLNDALTSFRIVAVAHAGAARFGHGAASIRTTQDLMLFSGLPPLVREGDDFSATFTVRNTTSAARTAKVHWVMRDRPPEDAASRTLARGEDTLALAAGEAKLLALPVQAPVGVERLYWEISTRAPDGTHDRLRATQRVQAVHPVRTFQATLARLDRPLEIPVERPAGALEGRGGIRVDVLGSLAGELTGVREYFERYPYTCLEQRVSRAVGLHDDRMWDAIAAGLPNHLDRDGLARYFPTDTLRGSDTLTVYLVQIAHASGREWPEQALGGMLKGLEAFVSGRIVRESALGAADLTLRKLAAIEALARHGHARAAMLDSITIDPPLWPTSALIDWIGILARVDAIPHRKERLAQALTLLRTRLDLQGTAAVFSTEASDTLSWLMVSADVNANRALLAVLAEAGWQEDLARLARGALARQKRGRWDTTVANAWGTVAMARFAQAFEKTPASGGALVSLAGAMVSLPIAKHTASHELAWPRAKAALHVAHQGSGTPWVIVQSRAALPLAAPVSAGFSVTRTVTPVEQKDKNAYSRGDVYRVRLEIDARADSTWVVVDDPIPAGATILGSGLARDAAALARGERREGGVSPAFVERAFDAYRAYYEYVPRGRFTLEYTVRVNNAGRFELPVTRVEALYAPEVFAEAPNAPVIVKP
jgi:alpha-2-macroglobulin